MCQQHDIKKTLNMDVNNVQNKRFYDKRSAFNLKNQQTRQDTLNVNVTLVYMHKTPQNTFTLRGKL